MQTTKPSEIKKSEKASILEKKCQEKILEAMKLRGYTLITEINSIKKQSEIFEFLCACGGSKKSTFNNLNLSILKKGDDFLPNCCIKSNKVSYKWFLDDSIKNSYIEPNTNIKWKQFEEIFWISENCNCINSKSGEEYKIQDNFVTSSFKRFNICNVMAILFQVPNFELLENNPEKYIAQFGENNNSEKNVSSIVIFEKSKINSDNRKNPNKKSEVNEENKKITPQDVEGIPHKTLDWFSSDYIFYENGLVYYKLEKDWYKFKLSKDERNIIRVQNRKENIDKRYYNDILMIMAFKPYQNFTEYEDYTKNRKLKIFHKNEKLQDDSINNLEVQIELTVIKKRALNVENRINTLHEEINRILKKKNGTLLTDLTTITAGTQTIYYTCICNPKNPISITVNNLKDTEDTKCKNCTQLRKNDTRVDDELNFEKNGEKFIKIPECYVGSNGTILSNDKVTTHTIRKGGDHSVKINNVDYNAKKLIVRAFKIRYYHYIDDKYENKFYVAFKDKTKENKYSIDNLFIWAYSTENQKLISDNKQFVTIKSSECSGKFKNELTNEEKSYINTNYIQLNEYPGYKFYSSGVIETNTGYITPGLKDSNDGTDTDNYYMKYTLNNETVKLHRLFCYAFNKLDGLTSLSDYDLFEVDHINGVKNDNRSSNLEWVLRKENIRRAIESGLCSYVIPVSAFILNKNGSKGELYKTYPCISWATKDTGCSYSHIKNIANGITSKAYKYIWEYVTDNDIKIKNDSINKTNKIASIKAKIVKDKN